MLILGLYILYMGQIYILIDFLKSMFVQLRQ